MYININLTPELTEQIQEQIKKELPRILEEVLLANDNKILKDILSQRVKSCVSSVATEILQGKNIRDLLRDKVMQEIGMSKECKNGNKVI